MKIQGKIGQYIRAKCTFDLSRHYVPDACHSKTDLWPYQGLTFSRVKMNLNMQTNISHFTVCCGAKQINDVHLPFIGSVRPASRLQLCPDILDLQNGSVVCQVSAMCGVAVLHKYVNWYMPDVQYRHKLLKLHKQTVSTLREISSNTK